MHTLLCGKTRSQPSGLQTKTDPWGQSDQGLHFAYLLVGWIVLQMASVVKNRLLLPAKLPQG